MRIYLRQLGLRPLDPLRIGVLGAAKIAPAAALEPSRDVDRVSVVAVASRDGARAADLAAAYGIETAVEGYASLLALRELNAVYIALPASEHHRWSLAALERGLHVLVEKPMGLNRDQVLDVVTAGEEAGLVVAEGFHWRFHPLATLMIDVTRRLRPIRRARAVLRVSIPDRRDIRWQLRLGGGALMDVGCYPVHWLRTVLQSEPSVLDARAELADRELDATIEASLAFPNVDEASIYASMVSGFPRGQFEALVELQGDRGFLKVTNPLVPQTGHRVEYEIDGESSATSITRRATYCFQLEAFRDAVTDGRELPTGGSDAVSNIETIDAVYRAAGLSPRGFSA